MTGRLVRGTRAAGRALTLALVVAMLLLGSVLGSPPPTASAAEHESGLEIDLTSVSPPFLRPGVPLTVAGTLTNHTASAVTGTTLTLRLQRNAPRTRSAIDFWLDLDITFATLQLARQSLDRELAPGESTTFRLTVPAEDFPLPAVATAFGTRGIAVDAEGRGGDAFVEATARTLLVWYPGTTSVPTTVSILVPLAPTATELIGAVLGGTSVTEQSGERIAALARATAGAPAVTWALDPLLLEGLDPVDAAAEPAPETAESGNPQPAAQDAAGVTSTPAAAATPTTTPTPTPTPTPDEPPADLGAVVRTLAQGREVLALPYADVDVAATTHAGATELTARAVATGQDLLREGGIAATDAIAWPAADTPDAATLAALTDGGASAVILPETAVPLRRTLTYTATGRTTLELTDDGRDTTVDALLSETVLSAALAGAAPAPGRDRQSKAARALDARQYVLAVTAMITRERPSDGRHVLAALPRAFNGDAGALAERIAVLSAAPWVTTAPISALRDVADPGFARAALPAERVERTEAPPEMFDQVLATSADLTRFSAIAEDPALLVRPEQRHLLQIASAAWRADTTGRVSFSNAVMAAATAVRQRVGVLSSGTVNLISGTGDLPVTVRNALDQPITAQLRLTPDGPSLRLPEVVTVQVPAGSEVAFPVRVNAVGSADVEVLAELLDPAGQPVGSAATLVVRVRADWENVGTAILAAIVGLAFIAGLVRSIRRSGRRGQAAPSPEDAST